MRILVAEHSATKNPELQISPNHLYDMVRLGDFYENRLATTGSESMRRVLVEWKNYGEHYWDEKIAKKLSAARAGH